MDIKSDFDYCVRRAAGDDKSCAASKEPRFKIILDNASRERTGLFSQTKCAEKCGVILYEFFNVKGNRYYVKDNELRPSERNWRMFIAAPPSDFNVRLEKR